MQSNIIRYTYDYIEELNKNFNGELNQSAIRNLQNIAKNLNTSNAVPIKLKYKLMNKWEKKNDNTIDTLDDFEIKINSLLNKLTNNSFDRVLDKIIGIVEYNSQYYVKIIDIFFEKALEESIYSNIYARLLGALLEKNSVFAEYKVVILNKCDTFYNTNNKIQIDTLTKEMKNNEVCNLNKQRTYILGGYVFISNLYNYDMISYDKITSYINQLNDFCYTFGKNDNSIYLDSIISIVSKCGNKLKKDNIEEFKKLINNIYLLKSNTELIQTKYKFKLLDLIEQFN